MSAGPITSPLPPSIYSSPVASPLSRDGVTIAVIDAVLDTSKIPKSGVLPGVIRDVSRDGTVRIDTDAGPITARLPDRVAPTPGQQVQVELPREDQGNMSPSTISRAQLSSAPPPDTPDHIDTTQHDFYTPAARPSSSAPTPDINTIAQTSTGIKLSSGEVVQVRAVSLPNAIKALAQSLSPTAAVTNLPAVTSTTAPLILSHSSSNPLISMMGDEAQSLFSLPFGSLFVNEPGPIDQTIDLFPAPSGSNLSVLPKNSQSFILPNFSGSSASLFPLTIPSLSPTSSSNFSMVIDNIQSNQIPTLITPGVMTTTPTPVNAGALSSSSFAQNFIVIGQTPTNETVIASGFNDSGRLPSTFIVPTNAKSSAWPTGTVFSATPVSTQQSSASSPSLLSSQTMGNDVIDFFDDVMSLNLSGPGVPMIRLPLPHLSTPQNFGPVLFMFMAALRSGSIHEMLGDTIMTTLKDKGRSDRIDKLNTMLRSLNSSSDLTPGSWRSFQIPIQTEHAILPVMLHIKNHPQTKDDQESSKDSNPQKPGQRVVMDVVFDRMGSVQMDMHLPHQSKRLDTILRTEIPLSRAMQGTITRLYAGAIAKTNLTGEIIFQGDRNAWVTVTQAQPADIKITA